MIRVDALQFAYPESVSPYVLRVGALSVAPASHVALVGPSGCGKTTLLHLIAGILAPSAGAIRVHDTEVTALDDAQRRDFRASRVGLVFQDFELIPYLNVRRNIQLPYLISPAMTLDADAHKRAEQLAQRMGIADKLDRNVRHLSQGERQRVAICRAVVTRPKLILADEPTGNLDPVMKRQTVDLLRESAREAEATLIVVTHDHDLLDGFDRVIDFADLTVPADAPAAGGAA